MLTINLKRGGLEIPGGHPEPLADGTMELPPQTATRETQEETGLRVTPGRLIPYGYVEATNHPASDYPAVSYMQLLSTYAPNSPGFITDPEVDGAGSFTIDTLRRMAERGTMIKVTEFGLACSGVRALFRYLGIPDEHITMP